MNNENILIEINNHENTWTPPDIPEERIANLAQYDKNTLQSNEYLCIFQTEPYIDSIYIEYDVFHNPIILRRFTFHKGYTWDDEDERFFDEHCIKEQKCSYPAEQIYHIFEIYNDMHPDWHVQRYLTKGLRLLDHIYNCLKGNTAKEILYKSGLDNLAVNIDEMDVLNLMARKPSELFDGLSMRVLRSLNCGEGAALLSKSSNRSFMKKLNKAFPDIFTEPLNDAQCMYIRELINDKLTVGETGRLFKSRNSDLKWMWHKSLYYNYINVDRVKREKEKLVKTYCAIDPFYGRYVKDMDEREIAKLEHYLLINREEYDKKIRRSNRKREYDWQERKNGYVMRYPQTINDFCREAVYMRNCLFGYIDALIENDTTILFMRRTDDFNKPFITMEIYKGELMQAYHRFNKDCTYEEAVWIINYCKRHGISTGKFKFNSEVDRLY